MNHPTELLIRIDKGTCGGTDINGATATLADIDDPEFGYYLLDGPKAGFTLTSDVTGNEINAWQACTAVPNEVIDRIHAAFYDNIMTPEQREAFQALETYTV